MPVTARRNHQIRRDVYVQLIDVDGLPALTESITGNVKLDWMTTDEGTWRLVGVEILDARGVLIGGELVDPPTAAPETAPAQPPGERYAVVKSIGGGYLVLPVADAILYNVHERAECAKQTYCVVHRPSFHTMTSWPLHWRDDRAIFERICEHGVGHPDPDQFDYWRYIGQQDLSVHGCDGCCRQ